jgi:alanine racemase
MGVLVPVIRAPNRVRIDQTALAHNVNQVKRLVSPKTRIMGIVKSDAYGHGAVPVSQALAASGVDSLGVAHLHEALELRDHGVRLPIVVLCGVRTREDADAAVERGLTPVLFDKGSAEMLAEACVRKRKKISIQVKIDTGMGRLGISCSDVAPFLQTIMGYKSLHPEAVMSHLATADEPERAFTGLQIDRFQQAIEAGRSLGLDLPLSNLANSAAVMARKNAHFDMVRPGIMLYGGLPSPGFQSPVSLKPVMHFEGCVLQTRDLPDRSPVSYGCTYHTRGERTIGVLSAGYGDGLPRSLSNRGQALIEGQRVKMVGRVCMNMTMVDVTGLKGVKPGTNVVFMGAQGDQQISGDDIARWGGTIAYEVFCSIGQRNPREYVS